MQKGTYWKGCINQQRRGYIVAKFTTYVSTPVSEHIRVIFILLSEAQKTLNLEQNNPSLHFCPMYQFLVYVFIQSKQNQKMRVRSTSPLSFSMVRIGTK